MARILILEDDEKLRSHLANALGRDGFSVHQAASITDLNDQVHSTSNYDVLILDRLIGNQDSRDSLPAIQRRWPSASKLILSAVNTPAERADLLNRGADDYIGKPFSMVEIVARVRALLRRSTSGAIQFISLGNTIIDLINRHVIVDSRICVIPAKEFLLLRALAQTPGRILNKADLLDTIWGSVSDTETNVVEATVTNLRKRLTDIGSSLAVKNARNLGYWIED